MDVKVLGRADSVSRRPFTSPRLYSRDQAILSYMVEDLRALLYTPDEDCAVQPYQPFEWMVHGLKRRVIVCHPASLRSGHADLNVVGFFGEKHMDRDAAPLEEANAEIVLEFRNFPGILSYSSMELADGNWANLVLHDKPDTREYWRASQRHAEAAQKLSPLYYRTVRIHNGTLPRGIRNGRTIVLQSTKYWDFTRPRVWRAMRDLTAAEAASG
jgi:hypothetical protein